MANVVISFDFDLDEDDPAKISEIMDGVAEVVERVNDGVTPMFGLEVDGEHRDPDDPATDLFS